MHFSVLTLFPSMFPPVLEESIFGRGVEKGILTYSLHNIRDYTQDVHRRVDDYPFGGGPGMVMTPQPLFDAIEDVTLKAQSKPHRIYLSPVGSTLTHEMAKRLAGHEHLLLVCGHYEGVDQRVIDVCIDEEVSIGDYVLTGGELPALVLMDTVGRLMPGVLGSDESAGEESFAQGLLEYPQYTRPQEFRGHPVPEVLLSGHHARIEQWRQERSRELTKRRRPDLLDAMGLKNDRKTK